MADLKDLDEFGFEPVDAEDFREDSELSEFGFEPLDLEEETVQEETGIGEALARGSAQGLTFGFADEITGALEAGYEATLGEDQLKDIIDNYAKYRDESRKEYEKAEKDQKAAYLTGEFGSGIATALLTGGAATPALARTAAKQALKSGATKSAAKMAAGKALAKQGAKQGAGLGAGYAAGESEADLTQGEVGEFVKDVAIGTGMGAGMGAITPALGKGLEAGSRYAGKTAKKLSKKGLTKAADLDDEIVESVLKDPKIVREAGDMSLSAEQIRQEGNQVLNKAISFSKEAKNQLTDDGKYTPSFVESTFNKIMSELNPADRQSKRQLLNLKQDIMESIKNKDLLSDKDLQKILDDVYELGYVGLKKDAADSTKKAIRKVGNEISQTIKEDNPAYKNLMAESEKNFKFVTDLSDMYGMNRAGIEASEDAIEGSALKFTQELQFPKRKTDTAITNLKKVIDPKKVDDKRFLENAQKNGFISEDFVKSNEARAIKELLDKDPSLKVGDLMSARALISAAGGAYTGTFLPYAFAIMSKPAARKLLMNMDRLGIKKGTEAANKYLEKMVTSGALSAAMQDVKEVTEGSNLENRKQMSDMILNMKDGDLMDIAESVKEKNKPLYNQLIRINEKPNNIKKGYLDKLLSDPSKRTLIKGAINNQEGTLDVMEDSDNADVNTESDKKKVGREPQGKQEQGILGFIMSDKIEGGYQNNPKDEGNYIGKKLIGTNHGITPKTYQSYFGKTPTSEDMKKLTKEQARKIYEDFYVNKPGFNKISDKNLKASLIDFGINSGPSRAIKKLQEIVGAGIDGILGPKTIRKVNDYKGNLYKELTNSRIKYIKSLKNSPRHRDKEFEKGWLSRIKNLDNFLKK